MLLGGLGVLQCAGIYVCGCSVCWGGLAGPVAVLSSCLISPPPLPSACPACACACSNMEGGGKQKDHSDKNWDLQVGVWLPGWRPGASPVPALVAVCMPFTC